MKINVPLRRKDAEIEISPCVVEKMWSCLPIGLTISRRIF